MGYPAICSMHLVAAVGLLQDFAKIAVGKALVFLPQFAVAALDEDFGGFVGCGQKFADGGRLFEEIAFQDFVDGGNVAIEVPVDCF